MASNNIPKEYLLTTDEFNNPKVLYGRDAISQLLVHLIMLEPGTYAARPKMGIGLVSGYRGMIEDDLNKLRNEIKNQIETYLPEFTGCRVDVSLDKDKKLTLDIVIDGTLYKYETVEQENNFVDLVNLS